jgi:phosphatidylserine/phosphatidylglycerophosphate/cardiolipin synthase-like enzyme
MATVQPQAGIELFFQSERAGIRGDLVRHLVDFIAAARQTLDCAIYDLRHPEVLQALARTAHSGKRLRIAYDAGKQRSGGPRADPKPSGTAEAIRQAGLADFATPVHAGRFLMHDKFLVRDSDGVWTGSANFTPGGLELQDNNCLAIQSRELAQSYASTFEGLLTAGHRHISSSAAATARRGTPAITIDGAHLTPLFEPAAGEGIETAIVSGIEPARRIRLMTFLISDPGILQVLSRFRDQPRADIRGVYDPNGMRAGMRGKDPSLSWFLQDQRFVAAPSHKFDPSREQDFMHNKVLILDDQIVLTGSYNFSENAESNDENALRIRSPAVAEAYTRYFNALFATYSAHVGGDGGRGRLARRWIIQDERTGTRSRSR